MSIEQVAMAMWAGNRLDRHDGQHTRDTLHEWLKEWPHVSATVRAIWRTRARTYLRALGKIK